MKPSSNSSRMQNVSENSAFVRRRFGGCWGYGRWNHLGCVLSLVILIHASVWSQQANLAVNPGFELGTTGWTFSGDSGWHQFDSQDPAHTGNAEAYVNISS